ncbi:MAG: hypothetical protein OEL77_03135 [Nitrosopumilus sp.]|nr:hypothetical protein [Nitrosopumilus sp.]MDH3384990.1 hypothetical protein [Nitrosopumilus sp.]
MTEDHKVLPKDLDSDYSLPGRLEESNPEYFEPPTVKSKSTNRIIVVIVISFVIISAGAFSFYFINQDQIDSKIIQSRISDPQDKLAFQFGVGKYGSDHAHAAIVVLVNGEQVNFGLPQFQLSSKYIHFENNNPYQIHLHATGVPLEMLFSSFGMKVTSDCIILNDERSPEGKTGKFCTDHDQFLVFYLNGEQYYPDISQYVIKHNDRILISLGDGKSIQKYLDYLESLQIYDVPQKIPRYSGDNITF